MVEAGGVDRLSLAPRAIRCGVPQGAQYIREWGRPFRASAWRRGKGLPGSRASPTSSLSASSGKFCAFVKKNFQELCSDLDGTVPRKSGEKVLYAFFRNGFAHRFAPERGFLIAEDHELDGRYAGIVEFNGVGKFIAINADRLAEDFLKLIESLKKKV
jgi:hypothetical protein